MTLVPFSQVICAEIPQASQAFNFAGGGARRSPRCTYPLILALEGNILDDCSITFPRSSARPWVPRVWPAPWPGSCGSGPRERRVRGKDRSESGAAPFYDAGGLRGSRKSGPRPGPGDVGGIRWVFVRVRHHGLARLASILWASVARAGQVDIFPAGVPDGQALVECVARPRFVGLYEGVLLGKVSSPGVFAVVKRNP